MALPCKLVSCFPQPRDTETVRARAATALSLAVGQWRRADFTAGRRQALSVSSTDKLRDYLMGSGGQDKYRAGLAALDDEQEELAQQRVTRQRAARRATIEALSHSGDLPEQSTARRGAIAGAILGIIPSVIMVLTSQPGPAGGDPVSNFLGGTACPPPRPATPTSPGTCRTGARPCSPGLSGPGTPVTWMQAITCWRDASGVPTGSPNSPAKRASSE